MDDRKELKPLNRVRRWLAPLAETTTRTPFEKARAQLAVRAEGVLGVMERVANLELQLLERLSPIVDNLGELVKLQLEEAREARRHRHGGDPPKADGRQTIIDVEVVVSESRKPR